MLRLACYLHFSTLSSDMSDLLQFLRGCFREKKAEINNCFCPSSTVSRKLVDLYNMLCIVVGALHQQIFARRFYELVWVSLGKQTDFRNFSFVRCEFFSSQHVVSLFRRRERIFRRSPSDFLHPV